ncbi:response regulator [Thermodesulfobacteriota bacterium]
MDRILIVDDEAAILMLYDGELTEEGYDVTTCSDGSQVLEVIKKSKPDIVLLDIRLGNYNGLDLLQEIRNTHYDLPVILCSSYPVFKYDMKSIAADYYVVKSANLDGLKAKIRIALEGRGLVSSEENNGITSWEDQQLLQ